MPISKTDLIYREDGSIYHLGLHPEQVPNVVLTVGDPERVPTVSQYFDTIESRVAHREFVSHLGRVGNRPVMVISSGMGTDNVEILMTELDALANVDLETRTSRDVSRSLTVIRLGTSGAIQPNVPLNSVVISRLAFGLDTLMQFYPAVTEAHFREATDQLREKLGLEFTPYAVRGASELISLFENQFKMANTLTCPGFYAPQGRQVRLKPRQGNLLQTLVDFRFSEGVLTNLEMETAGYYALGKLLGHKMLSVNAILADRVSGKFSSNPHKTINRMIEQVLSKLDDL